MTTFDLQDQVGRLVAELPARSRVFEKHGIDYCCGGKRSLDDACRRKGVDPSVVVEELRAVGTDAGVEDVNPLEMTLTELADHIEATHHEYLRTELPRLQGLVDKVARVHGGNYSWLIEVKSTYTDLVAELVPHMVKEEQILFPLVRELDRAVVPPQFHCGSVNNPIRMMEYEHEVAGEALGKLRTLTTGYTAPTDACNTFRAMLDGLSELEEDLHRHIHKENNVLFPRASERESMVL